MFLHIGNNQMIKLADVIAIINLQTVYENQEALQLLEKILQDKEKQEFQDPCKNDSKSLIINESTYYYSTISATTLLERSRFSWVS